MVNTEQDDRYVRINDIIGNAKKGIPAIIAIGRSSWWNGVRSGKFPRPIKLGARTTCWRLSDVLKCVEAIAEKPWEPAIFAAGGISPKAARAGHKSRVAIHKKARSKKK